MKVKEVSRTANIAWSPAKHHPIMLAAGTAAQQLDATFSTTASLEIFRLDLSESGTTMPLEGSVSIPQRCHKLLWCGLEMEGSEGSGGAIIAGSDNGLVTVWSPKAVSEGEEGLLFKSDQHSGPVRSLDVNPFQSNLLASGASDSEIFIWDLNNPQNPMTPGSKTQPPEDISCVAWNCQVQHILGSTAPSGRSVVWDLRKNEPIIQISDHSSKIRCKAIGWHPDIATQLATASEDDRSPVVQLWDLRFATSPMKVLEHQRGILSMAWCPHDADLLITCSKDNRVVCWNPNSSAQGGEIVYELPTTSQWTFEALWCPRNPAAVATASFDGHISVFSLMGGQNSEEEQKNIGVADDNDPFGQSMLNQHKAATVGPLKKPPKWMRRPCGATWGFGGRLATFNQSDPKKIRIHQITTEKELMNRSQALEAALNDNNVMEFCNKKISESDADEKRTWEFLKICFSKEPRQNFLSLLGYKAEELETKFGALSESHGVSAGELAEKMEDLTTVTDDDSKHLKASAAFESASPADASPFDNLSPAGSRDERASREPRKLTIKTQVSSHVAVPFSISTDDDVDGLLSKALLTGNFELAVEICLFADRLSDALVLAVAGGADLFTRTQQIYFQKQKGKVSRLLSAVVQKDWLDIIQYGELQNWPELLAALLTYAKPEEFSTLCDVLGSRLEADQDLKRSALLCYICAGNVEKLVECWLGISVDPELPLSLQDLIEKVMILRKAVQMERQRQPGTTGSPKLAQKLQEYAILLASQGDLATSILYLEHAMTAKDDQLEWRDRVYHAQSHCDRAQPDFPFAILNILPEKPVEVRAPAPAPEPALAPVHAPAPERKAAPSFAQVPAPSMNQPKPMPWQPSASTSNPIPSPIPSSTGSGSGPAVYNPRLYQETPSSGMRPGPPPPLEAQQVPPPSRPPHQPIKSAISYQERPPQGAWNDPPQIQPQTKTPTAYVAPAPIMAPIGGSPAYSQSEPYNPSVQTGERPPTAHNEQLGYAPPPPPASQKKEAMPTPPPVMKAAIPAEHLSLVQTFDDLLDRCGKLAKTPSMKRKVDDVKKKLEVLADKLREMSLSQSTLGSLYQMSQAIQIGDYQTGLSVHTNLVSTGNFNEISGFMPGIKTLLQMSLQLRL
ncbi:protein transport protein Sec31A-like [Oscarella lobularis]|uniref:protein transport protein Sec31A-like n=1 Tax=Oscarella lobularis TaxID=121494 RepID=UPI003313A2FD